MLAAGVEFYVESVAVSESRTSGPEGEDLLGYDERALIKSLKINEKWIDFRRRERLTYSHESYDLLYDRVAAETSDFGEISSKFANFSFGRDLELAELTERLARRLNEILEELHGRKVELGFKQIAIHRVWWKYDSEQNLGLDCVEPECKTDEKLAEHIVSTYSEVRNMNRQSTRRRREKLEGVCREGCAEVYQSHGRRM